MNTTRIFSFEYYCRNLQALEKFASSTVDVNQLSSSELKILRVLDIRFNNVAYPSGLGGVLPSALGV